MRKFTMIVFMSLLLGVGLSGIAFAGPGPGKVCNDNDDFGFDHDTCTVCVAQGFPDVLSPTCACKAFQDLDLLPDGVSLGDCISFFQPGT